MRSPLMLVVALAVSCGTAPRPAPQIRMSPRDIIDSSSPAIVRIEAGEAKVGTGFILGADGLIATNLHVIEGESNIRVKLFKDQTEYPAIVIAGVDKSHDLALLRITPKKALPVLRLGDSSMVSAGDRIYAIGNPLGVFDYSITDGLISQVRPLSQDLTILQISAAISQGSSGGPLFNQFGEVIGVTTAIITQGQAINLAVPANYLRAMMKQPIAMSTQEFARDTKEAVAIGEDDVSITRQIPNLTVETWDGCKAEDVQATVQAITSAIAIGAPLYNGQTRRADDPTYDPRGFEACYRVYEGTAVRFDTSGPCNGVRTAFHQGLARGASMKSYKEKAWAMRDTFDGLLRASVEWCVNAKKSCPDSLKQLLSGH